MKILKQNNYVENLKKMMSDWTSERAEIAKNIADIEERYRKRIEEEKKLLDIELQTYDLRIEKLNAVIESFGDEPIMNAGYPAAPDETIPEPEPSMPAPSEPEPEPEPENPIQDTLFLDNNEDPQSEAPEAPAESEASDFTEAFEEPAEEPEADENDSDWPDTVEEWN